MKYYVNTSREAYKLANSIEQRKLAILIACKEYPSDEKYFDVCIYYGVNKNEKSS